MATSQDRSRLRIRRISFVRVKTDLSDSRTAFTRNGLGLNPGHRDDGWAVVRLESGEHPPSDPRWGDA